MRRYFEEFIIDIYIYIYIYTQVQLKNFEYREKVQYFLSLISESETHIVEGGVVRAEVCREGEECWWCSREERGGLIGKGVIN